MGTTLFWEITVFAKLPFLLNYRFCEIAVYDKLQFLTNYLSSYSYIYTAKVLVGAIIILAPQLKWSDTPFDSEWAPPSFEKLPFLLNYRFWQITIFFICTYILQKSELEAITILEPQLKWWDTPFESEWEPSSFEKLPFSLNYRFCDIAVFDKLQFLTNYRFFLFVHLYCRRACWRQLLF